MQERTNREHQEEADGIRRVAVLIKLPVALYSEIAEMALECEIPTDQFAAQAVEVIAATRRAGRM